MLASYALLAALVQPEPFAVLEFESPITHLEVAPRVDLLAVAEGCGSLHLLDAQTLRERRKIDLAGPVLDLAISHDGNWIAVQDAPGTVTIWNIAAKAPIRELRHEGGAFAFFAKTSELVLADDAGTVRRVDAASGRLGESHTFEDARGIEAVEISRDGRVVAYALDDG